MSCGLLGYNTPADHKMEILRALVKFVNQILRTYCCKKKQKKTGPVTAVLCVGLHTKIRVNVLLLYEQDRICLRLHFPLSYAPGCCFVIKNGWRRVGGMLSESPLEQAGPFLSTRECPVLWLFVLAHVSPCQASSSFFLSFLLSSTHPFRPSKFSSALFYTGFFVGSSFVENRRE